MPLGRLPSLDGWRAIAVCLVLGSHVPYSGAPAPLSAAASLLFDGNLGVRIFFTISGFIITWLLLREETSTGQISLGSFWQRRALRILPVVFGYLALLGALQWLGRVEISPNSWVGNLAFCRNIVGRGNDPSVHLWSLAVEEQFYLIWPLLLTWLAHRRNLTWAFAILVLSSAVLVRWLIPDELPNENALWPRLMAGRSIVRYWDSLMIGCMAALWASRRMGQLPRWAPPAGAGLLIIPLLCQQLGLHRPALLDAMFPTLQAFGSATLILWTISTPSWFSRLLGTRLMVAVGLLSYSLYVWHFICLEHFAPGALPSLFQAWWFWPLPTLCMATLSYALLEWPARAHRRRKAAA